VSSLVIHDEGRLSFFGDLRKKLYYGRSFGRYMGKHPGRAVRKLARGVFIRKLPTMAGDPFHAIGLVAIKILELGALLIGILVSGFRPHPSSHKKK
jgi:hypothetical protein